MPSLAAESTTVMVKVTIDMVLYNLLKKKQEHFSVIYETFSFRQYR